eukprot:1243522-Prorocentrum_lima.AAC.1
MCIRDRIHPIGEVDLKVEHGHFSHRVSAVKYSREARTPNMETAMELESVTKEELKMLEADEKA